MRRSVRSAEYGVRSAELGRPWYFGEAWILDTSVDRGWAGVDRVEGLFERFGEMVCGVRRHFHSSLLISKY